MLKKAVDRAIIKIGENFILKKGAEIMPEELWQLLGLYLLAVNVAAFLLMGADKGQARRGAWRVPERTLFLPVLLGGALGGVLGMQAFRHKTRHWYFRWGFPLLAALQIGLAVWSVST